LACVRKTGNRIGPQRKAELLGNDSAETVLEHVVAKTGFVADLNHVINAG
jgi:hypothetical protein